MNKNIIVVLTVILLALLTVVVLPKCMRYEGYSGHDFTVVSLKDFTNGISRAVITGNLSSICRLSGVQTLGLVPTTTIKIPEIFDLRNYDLLTPVMNQEMCGGCWAFGVVGMLADRLSFSRWTGSGRPGSRNYTGSDWKDLVLSPQYLISCDADNSAQGCNGSSDLLGAVKACTKGEKDMMYGLPNGVMLYAVHPFDVCQHENSQGVVGNKPGTDGKGLKCGDTAIVNCDKEHMMKHFRSSTPIFTFKNYYSLSSNNFDNDVKALKEEIYKNGPVAIGINVYSNLYDTRGDIAKGVVQTASGSLMGGHCVVVVGWGKDYFIIKNSWGPKWGLGGYWLQSSTDTYTLSFGGPGINAVAGIPNIPADLTQKDILFPVIPE